MDGHWFLRRGPWEQDLTCQHSIVLGMLIHLVHIAKAVLMKFDFRFHSTNLIYTYTCMGCLQLICFFPLFCWWDCPSSTSCWNLLGSEIANKPHGSTSKIATHVQMCLESPVGTQRLCPADAHATIAAACMISHKELLTMQVVQLPLHHASSSSNFSPMPWAGLGINLCIGCPLIEPINLVQYIHASQLSHRYDSYDPEVHIHTVFSKRSACRWVSWLVPPQMQGLKTWDTCQHMILICKPLYVDGKH